VVNNDAQMQTAMGLLALLALLAAVETAPGGGDLSLDPVLSTVAAARYRRGTGDLAQTV
jgi:hypothetical protein